MLQRLFHQERENLDYFFAHLDYGEMEALFAMLLACQGVLFVTGVGKSGFVAQKIAATLHSTGTRAHYLPPLDALHGDLGMVTSEDCVLFLSKSGESEELLHLLPAVRAKGAKSAVATTRRESRLAKRADYAVLLPCLKELCPFDLAPTTSTQTQLLFGDALAMALMQAKGFSMETFLSNHPAGQIGKRMQMRVSDLMLVGEKVPLCKAESLLQDLLEDLSSKRCGCLIAVDGEQRIEGIFTDGDLRRSLQAVGERVLAQRLGKWMTRSPRTVEAKALAWDALKLMESDPAHPITVLPVVTEGRVVGIIKMHDILQAGI